MTFFDDAANIAAPSTNLFARELEARLKPYVVHYRYEGRVRVYATDREAARFCAEATPAAQLMAGLGDVIMEEPEEPKPKSGVLDDLHNGREVAR